MKEIQPPPLGGGAGFLKCVLSTQIGNSYIKNSYEDYKNEMIYNFR